MTTAYDSTIETNKHRSFVRMLMYQVARDVVDRVISSKQYFTQ